MKTCPKCGGSMTVKKKEGISVCRYCESTFSLTYLDALDAMQLESASPTARKTQNDFISTGSSADRLVKSAETNMSLGDYSSAFKNFEQASKLFPEDFRGWYGMARASTQGFLVLGNPTNVEHWWSYTTKLASKAQLLKCKNQYSAYLTLRGKSDADTDMRVVSDRKAALENEIETLQRKIAGLHSAHKQSLDRSSANVNIARAALQKAEKKSQGESIRNMFLLLAGIALGFLTLWTAIDALINPSRKTIINILGWIVIACMGGGSLGLISSGTDKTCAKEHDKARNEFEAARQTASAIQSETVDETPQNEAIQQCMQKIALCEKYLGMREKVTQYHIKKRIKEIDENISLSSYSTLIHIKNQIFSDNNLREG